MCVFSPGVQDHLRTYKFRRIHPEIHCALTLCEVLCSRIQQSASYKVPQGQYKLEMSRLSVVFVVVLVFLFVCSRANGQLNFSTGWGKRGLGSGTTGVAGGDPVNCKTSVDSLMIIYKLIQSEAQKQIECDKFSN